MLSFKKPEVKMGASKPVQPFTPLVDYIPYYSHYDHRTILTKNGDLMQIIKIDHNTQGLNYEGAEGAGSSLRAIIRQAVTDSLMDDRYALWIHTVRKRKPIRFDGQYDNPFAAYVYDKWQQKHRWQYQYYNEVYLTVIHEGQEADLLNSNAMKEKFLPQKNRAFRNHFLEQSHGELNMAMEQLLARLRGRYHAHVLGIVERFPERQIPTLHQPIFYSEPMEFLSTLLNLSAEPHPLSEADIASAINHHALTFGYNALETKSPMGVRRFGAMLTLKQYIEAPPETMDRVLQSSAEMIVSQSFDFVHHKEALKGYRAQKDLFTISGDRYSSAATGLDDLMAFNRGRSTDFGEQETSIMLIVDDYKQLEPTVTATQSAFGELGMTAVREDIMLEECFWAQLPGNFEFIRRKDYIATQHVAGFARLNRFPVGLDRGAHWHEALTVVPTQVRSPYFFNFHRNDNGHTLLLDFNSFGDAAGNITLNFLLTTSMKYSGRLICFDRDESMRLMYDKLGMPYHPASAAKPLSIDPFALENSPRNHSFLTAWFALLAEPHVRITDKQRDALRLVIEGHYAEGGGMSRFLEQLQKTDAALTSAIREGMTQLFGCRLAGETGLDLSSRAVAFNLDTMMQNPTGGVASFAYLLHRVITGLDGQPTVIVIREAIDVLDNAFFAPRLESLLEMLKQHNALIIFTQSAPQDYADNAVMQALMQQTATKLIIPDEINVDYAALGLGISAQDGKLLKRMERVSGDLLFKQDGESISLRIDLHDLGEIKPIFANDIKNMVTAGGKFADLPKSDV